MGKRSNFERRERDFYPTPYEAVLPLLPHLRPATQFDEPCAGAFDLAGHLEDNGYRCARASDIEPQVNRVAKIDVFDVKKTPGLLFITNPPWPQVGKKGQPTVGIANHLSSLRPTWLLLSADFAHNQYFSQLNCVKIVSVGRVKWIPDSDGPGKDNCAWYLFDKKNTAQTTFHHRPQGDG